MDRHQALIALLGTLLAIGLISTTWGVGEVVKRERAPKPAPCWRTSDGDTICWWAGNAPAPSCYRAAGLVC